MGFIFVDEPIFKKVVFLVPVIVLLSLLALLWGKTKYLILIFKRLFFPNEHLYKGDPIECNSNEPNVPNPSRPWCGVCAVHSEFNVKLTYTGAEGSTKKELYYCAECKNEMHIPSVVKYLGENVAKLWLRVCLYICLPVGLFGFGVESLKNESSFDGAGLLLIFLVVGGGYCIMLIIYRNYSNFYRKWKKWANENGY